MGIGTMTTSIAPTIGPTYGGVLLNSLGWRAIFWFLIVLLVISLVMGLTSMPIESVEKTEKFALPAFITLGLGLGLLLIAIEKMSLLWIIIALVVLVIYFQFNKRQPLLRLSILRNRKFNAFLYSFLVYQAILLGLSFILPNYLQLGMHVSATAAGLFMFPGAVIGSVLAPISGRLLDRVGATKPILTGVTIATIALLLMAGLFGQLNFWLLMAVHMLLMVGIGLSYANLMTITLATLPAADNADGNSILNTLTQFIGASATAVVAQIFASAVAAHANTGVVRGSQLGVVVLAVLVVVSLVVFIINRPQK